MRHRLAPSFALAVLVTACTAPSSSPFDEIGLAVSALERAPTDPVEAAAAADAINAFGLDLYRLMAAAGDDNLVVSPASIALALGMARPGARGVTADEMDAVLYGVASDTNPNLLNSLEAALADRSGTFTNAFDEEGEVALRIAKAAFAQHGFPLEQAYLDALAERFGSGLQLVDYAADPEAAEALINRWVTDETEGRIPRLLPAGVIDKLTRLTLVNAILLRTPWHAPFDAGATWDEPFTTSDGSTITVPMMHTELEVPYASGDGWQAVELSYVGEQLAMMVIVPDDMARFDRTVDAALLAEIVDALEGRHVALGLPSFSVETHVSLNALLAELGMPSAFDRRRADFSGMTTEWEGLVITDVIHQANIEVDEDGTEASAATAVVIGFTSGGPPDQVSLTIDRPFLFAVRDTQSGAVLFLGRVTDPTTGG